MCAWLRHGAASGFVAGAGALLACPRSGRAVAALTLVRLDARCARSLERLALAGRGAKGGARAAVVLRGAGAGDGLQGAASAGADESARAPVDARGCHARRPLVACGRACARSGSSLGLRVAFADEAGGGVPVHRQGLRVGPARLALLALLPAEPAAGGQLAKQPGLALVPRAARSQLSSAR